MFLYHSSHSIITQAFVLTDEIVHYRTEDRGKTWRPFEVLAPPASVAQPLSFHSDPKNVGYILYQGTDCETIGGWRARCRDHVIDFDLHISETADFLEILDVLHQRSLQRRYQNPSNRHHSMPFRSQFKRFQTRGSPRPHFLRLI